MDVDSFEIYTVVSAMIFALRWENGIALWLLMLDAVGPQSSLYDGVHERPFPLNS